MIISRKIMLKGLDEATTKKQEGISIEKFCINVCESDFMNEFIDEFERLGDILKKELPLTQRRDKKWHIKTN